MEARWGGGRDLILSIKNTSLSGFFFFFLFDKNHLPITQKYCHILTSHNLKEGGFEL